MAQLTEKYPWFTATQIRFILGSLLGLIKVDMSTCPQQGHSDTCLFTSYTNDCLNHKDFNMCNAM
jgi:hypothetical protein